MSSVEMCRVPEKGLGASGGVEETIDVGRGLRDGRRPSGGLSIRIAGIGIGIATMRNGLDGGPLLFGGRIVPFRVGDDVLAFVCGRHWRKGRKKTV